MAAIVPIRTQEPTEALLRSAAVAAAGRYWLGCEDATASSIIRDALSIAWTSCNPWERPNLTRAVLLGEARSRVIVRARFYAILRLRRDLGLSTPAIGRIMHRDHSAVIYGLHHVAQVDAWLDGLGLGRRPHLAIVGGGE